ncbi:interferon omega-1-like [Python bivittatus]|uniref:Interferon omega-1-like n=1 Tax=Python bivittatus TaxID=176946 RepID=A0A9F5MQZ5_PYTBI|nr:interferon omega-1-like [Python bivittatus]
MNTKGWLLQICLAMFFTKISSQHCDQLHRRLHKASKGNLKLLGSNIRATIPLQCIGDIIDFSHVNEENLMSMDGASHEENAKITIQEMLQQIDLIFKQVHAELFWDENSLRQFHTGLYQQIKELEICQNAEIGDGTISARDQKLQLTRLRVKRYFQRLSDYLKDKKYSLCAWEIVQIQLRECFLLINELIQRIPTLLKDLKESLKKVQYLRSPYRSPNKHHHGLTLSPAHRPVAFVLIWNHFNFPMGKNIGSIKEDARATVGLMLEHIQRIFWHNFTKAEWNMTVTELFQIVLDQQVVQWETCSVTVTGEKATFKDIRTKLKLKKYFLRLDTFLKDEEYSPCAWDVVRQEVLGIHFVFLDQLLRTLQN